MAILFRMTKDIEGRIDSYLDTVSEGMIVFGAGVEAYLKGNFERFGERIVTVTKLEGKADQLRRDIENSMYSYSLIPEHRGDVLRLLETIDDVIDAAKKVLRDFQIETPLIPEACIGEFLELTNASCQASEYAVLAARAFFRDLAAVKNHLHKTYFYEREADSLRDSLMVQAFANPELDLAHKNHLRYFIYKVDKIADDAQEVADGLTISAIKRSL